MDIWSDVKEEFKDGRRLVGLDLETGTLHVTWWDRGWHDPDNHYYSEATPFNPTRFMEIPLYGFKVS